MSLFFELIRVAVQQQGKLSVNPTAEEWKKLYKEAKRQALVGVLYSAVEQLPVEQQPPKEVLLPWYVNVQQIKRFNVQLDKIVPQVVRFFADAGWRSVILKGQGVARYYPQPWLRMPGDIDIWVDASRDDILNLLRQYEEHISLYYLHAEFRHFKPAMVEVHFMPSWMSDPFRNMRLQRFFKMHTDEQMSHKVNWGSEPNLVAVPTNEFNALFLLLHIYRHFFDEGIGLRQLMDYYYVLRNGITEKERDEVVKMIKKMGLERFTGAVMYILCRVFGMEKKNCLLCPDEREGKFLLKEVLLAGNFGHFDSRLLRKDKETRADHFVRRVKRNLRFWRGYPREVFSIPLFKVWHTCWRKYHGY